MKSPISFATAALLLACALPTLCVTTKIWAQSRSSTLPFERRAYEWGRVISLDGEWEIGEGSRETPPSEYRARIPVPGLVTSAKPEFQNVGAVGGPREAYWYRTNFRINGAIPATARLKIGKAMYGTKVFLNGNLVGESPLNFTPLYFSVARFLKGGGESNELVVRIGAEISAAPDTVVNGGDPERRRYPPGIYDRVQLLLSDATYVSNVQVAPDVNNRSARVAVEFSADEEGARSLELKASVLEWKTGRQVCSVKVYSGAVNRGKPKVVEVTLPIEDGQLWTPESPNLYVLDLTDGHYRCVTRFGLRTFQLDQAYTNRALLNGTPCFLRGTNFAVHRFFEDRLCRDHPWDEKWVRKLFRRFTRMQMNAIRMTLGPAPELWYEIADEEGMMIFDEYAIWYPYQPRVGDVTKEAADPYRRWGIWPKHLTTRELIAEYTAWMRERWNHPSVIVWDAQNETWATETGEALKAVRPLDLSNRPWDNGWSSPDRATDIREAHPYFERWVAGTEMVLGKARAKKPFTLADLATAEKLPSTFYRPFQSSQNLPPNGYWTQPCVINEYSYLWLNRDGSPTTLTKPYYDEVLGPAASVRERRELRARDLAAVTEYWRATRSCFGVLYPFGIAGSIGGGATCDSFMDVEKLEFDSQYLEFVPDAFAAVGICAELWQTRFKLDAWNGTQAEFSVAVINDTGSAIDDHFEIRVLKGDALISAHMYAFRVCAFGVERRFVKVELPNIAGKYEVVATLHGRDGKPVSSRRSILLHE